MENRGQIFGNWQANSGSLENSPGLLSTLREGINEGEAEKIRQAAHGLKSSSVNLGAIRLAEVCRQMEICGRNGEVEKAAALLAGLEMEYGQACAALHRELAGTAGKEV